MSGEREPARAGVDTTSSARPASVNLREPATDTTSLATRVLKVAAREMPAALVHKLRQLRRKLDWMVRLLALKATALCGEHATLHGQTQKERPKDGNNKEGGTSVSLEELVSCGDADTR